MKRIFCLLLAVLTIFALCACSDKEKEKKSKNEETTEQTESKEAEEIVTAPDDDTPPEEIGSLPIIFGDEDPDQPKQDDPDVPTTSSKTPSTSSKAPSTSTPQNPIVGDGTVVETPIIPFN